LSFRSGESTGIEGFGDGVPFDTEGSVNGLDALASGTLSTGGGAAVAVAVDEAVDEGLDAGRERVLGLPAFGRITMTDSVTVSVGVVTVSCIRT
jgi:hypothetical protein